MLTFFVTMKGGSGKSTTLCNLAPLISRKQRTGIVDRDPNGTTARWLTYRGETPGLTEIPGIHEFEDTQEAYEKILRFMAGHEYCLFDMPGQDNTESRTLLYYLAETSPRPMTFVVPVKPSQPDLDLLPKVQDLIANVRARRAAGGFPDARAFYVVNEAPSTTQQERKDTITFMSSLGIKPLPSHLHARKAFRDSMALGKSVVEMKDAKAADEIKAIYRDAFLTKVVRQSTDNVATMGG